MAKFNITVEIDYIDEEGNLDQELYDRIVDSVVSKVSEKVSQNIAEDAEEQFDERKAKIQEKINEKLNSLMEEFFSTPRNIYDNYGDVVRSNVTVKQTLKEACDKFMTAKVDSNGKETTSSYYNDTMTRVEYMVRKVVNKDMECAIARATDEISKAVKEKVSNEVKKQMGEKLGAFVGIDELLKGKK